MKKVLFYFGNYCSENSKGGTEVATYRIAKALKDTGQCEIYHAFHNYKGDSKGSVYSEIIELPKSPALLIENLADFIRRHKIEDVVVMGRFFKFGLIKKAIEKSGESTGLFFMQHFAPGSEKKKTTYSSSWHLLKLNPRRTRYYLRALFYPLLKLPRTIRWGKVYREVYEHSDKVVLLSDGYKKDYCKVASLKDDSKIVAIPNIFQLPEGIETKKFLKEKRVLILSRMDEIQKRISLALKIWKKIEDSREFADWHLDIVGDGNNTDIVKRLIRKYQFKNVTFHGWQDREKFLERSAILMMTSEYEGLPLSLLEAQAYGVVPIAFNSFASLQDIIQNDRNGVVVDRFGDIDEYTFKLKKLMGNEEYRLRLNSGSSLFKDRFSSEKIARQWLRILT